MTRAELAAALRALGVSEGGVLMVHTRMSALGHVDGAQDTVVEALLDVLGPDGTLCAYVAWADHTYDGTKPWAVFDAATSPADPDHGRIPERIRTWPGARRSWHPDASVAAIGRRAEALTHDHPQVDAYGADSPFGRLKDAGGQVLMLGAPLDTLSILHHAEAIAAVPGKHTVTYTVATTEGDRTYTDLDTEHGAFDYSGYEEDEFVVIARAALKAGVGHKGFAGPASCHLFDAATLTAFAVRWLEDEFGSTVSPEISAENSGADSST